MSARRSLHTPSIAVVIVGYIIGLIAYPVLPGIFLVERPSARMLVAFTLPTTALALYAVFHSLWTHDRVRTGNGVFEATYQAIVLRTLLFVVALHALVMMELTRLTDRIGLQLHAGRTVVVLFGIALIAIGNLLPRTRPNIALGIRTDRTLANADLWQRVHRVGGYATVGLGAAVAIAGLIATHRVIGGVISASALCAATAVLRSYRKYARA
jgi:uncharacterized membrane protein